VRIALVVVGVVLLAGCAGALLAGCGGARNAAVSVTPGDSLEDQPVAIRVTGLPADRLARIVLHSTDSHGVRFSSAASYRADGDGVIDVTRASALSGSYSGVWGTGLVALLEPVNGEPHLYYWNGRKAQTFHLTVRVAKRVVASASFDRRFSAIRLGTTRESPAREGFYGAYFVPPLTTARPAVLVLGGSEGGLSTYLLAAAFAAHGYPALALAYFGAPGLPQTLQRIPLEYFARALRWLGSRPHVDPSKLVAVGISRGSEAAELLGVHYPALVHAVVAGVPSNVANCGLTASDQCSGPTWTLDGKALPYTHEFDEPYPVDVPAAAIPVERIRGPIFLVCGDADEVWTSCPYAHAIVDRLVAHHSPYRHELDSSLTGGHPAGWLLPDEPGYSFEDSRAQTDEQERERTWPRLLRFLAAL
jgi:dienelactone hydrolase